MATPKLSHKLGYEQRGAAWLLVPALAWFGEA